VADILKKILDFIAPEPSGSCRLPKGKYPSRLRSGLIMLGIVLSVLLAYGIINSLVR